MGVQIKICDITHVENRANGLMMTRPFSAENRYATEAEAHTYGITYAQRIIDGKVLGLSVNYKSCCHREVCELV